MNNLEYENKYWEQEKYVLGIDEVGLGCIAGPMVVTGVIFKQNDIPISDVTDSKKLSEKKRKQLDKLIREKAVFILTCEIDSSTIDKIGVHSANDLAQKGIIEQALDKFPDLIVLVDGNKAPKLKGAEIKCIVKGDQLSYTIGAASIVAKVYRDDMMEKFSLQFPKYGFEKHKGYGVPKHIEAVRSFGMCPLHRRSFDFL